MATVGYKIKKVREIKNLTQDYMADKLAMSVTGYGKIERDEVDLPYSRLEQIANVLNLKVEDLVAFDEKNVFNVMYNKIGRDLNVNSMTNDEREVYKKTITLLEEKIQTLEERLR